ncbi:single-stranded DNA-binding protein [Jatrophihabitans sp. DSM 45814]
MMYDSTITIIGNVVDEIVLKTTDTGVSRLSFRVAHTKRRKDRETGEWVDGNKLFINVVFWREFAENVALSLKKGDPIMVCGELFSRQYVKDEINRVSYEIDACSIGHDLARGVSKFERRRRGMSGSVVVDADGLPERLDDEGDYLMVEDQAEFAAADRVLANAFATAG